MTKRKKRLFVIQIALLLLAIIIIYLTYYNKEKSESIIKIEDQQKILTQKIEDNGNTNEPIKNKFTDIEYSGLDLNGNRYILKSKKAEFEVEKPELIFMQIVEATFYFKDGTILYVNSDEGIYNNKSLDMIFKKNVNLDYEKHFLNADNAEFLNTKNQLNIWGNVFGEGIKGKIAADKLNFDLTKQTLDISMFANEQINVNLYSQ
tara:strand:+ start:2668 stop:3282 length:615 start_codon:yes stop_codon:yes gene_type:complete